MLKRGLHFLLIFWAVLVHGAVEEPKSGVERKLAFERRSIIREPFYNLNVSVPGNKADSVEARLQLRFISLSAEQDLILDFSPEEKGIYSLTINGSPAEWHAAKEHLVLSRRQLRVGANQVDIAFKMGEMSLNRRDDLLYTLFVPDRARTAFPCFDQPDLKGRIEISLEIPEDWDGLTNGPLVAVEKKANGRKLLRFSPSHPLPTYLMAFVAGKLNRVEQTRSGRRVQLFHQENDEAVLKRNLPAVFDQVFSSLSWMETYTGVSYPFDKYDLVLVPSFQYGGMEHCGATLYRASHLLLDEQSTLEQQLSRASLIAHETAHMWFGDLVTMPWFDEVWLKEVFAGFMADKMVAQLFPDIDHRLKFLLGHNPAALGVDRSQGTHPITQHLDNLSDAGTVYGSLIYHKAPIVMDQLERRVGRSALQQALGQYLREHAYGNAGWDPLIDLLATKNPGLKEWSRGWVYESSLPTITVKRLQDSIMIKQHDERGKGRLWSQHLGVLLVKGDKNHIVEMELGEKQMPIPIPDGFADPDLILPAGNGVGYGRFILDMRDYARLLAEPVMLEKPLWRGAAWLSLWEGALDGYVKPSALLETALRWMESEENQLVLERMLGDISSLYWRLLSQKEREDLGSECENRIWMEMEQRPVERRPAFFDAFRKLAVSSSAQKRLADILKGEKKIEGITLSEQKELNLLVNLGVFHPDGFDALLDQKTALWKSTDRKNELAFLRPLFSKDPDVWLTFFRETLSKAENREQEPWVLKALSLIHHPLRCDLTRMLIPELLAMLPEIQRTGDIFFPIGWVGESLWGHQSSEAALMVRNFLESDKTLSKPLRLKVLQGADYLLRQHKPAEQRIRRVVDMLCSLPQPRNTAHPEMLNKAASLIEETWQKQGWTVQREAVPFEGGPAWNLSVLWGDEKSPRLVLGAHYDVCGNTPGADDNASGIAVLMELSNRLRDLKTIKGRSVELVAYALEEPPFFGSDRMGSFVHAHQLWKKKKKVVLMMAVDMVGFYADTHSFLGVIGRNEDKMMIEKVAALMAGEHRLNTKALPYSLTQRGIDWSDHRNFWRHNYPALMIHSCPFFQNPDYHRTGDTPDKLDFGRLVALSNALFDVVNAWPF